MSDENSPKQLEVEKIAEGFFSRLKEVLVETIEDVAKVVAGKKEESAAPAGTKLGLVKGTGTDGEAKTDPAPAPAEPTTSQRRALRPV